MMVNPTKNIDTKYVRENRLSNYLGDPYCVSFEQVGDDLWDVRRKQRIVNNSSPIHVAFYVLAYAKICLNRMYAFFRENIDDRKYEWNFSDTGGCARACESAQIPDTFRVITRIYARTSSSVGKCNLTKNTPSCSPRRRNKE